MSPQRTVANEGISLLHKLRTTLVALALLLTLLEPRAAVGQDADETQSGSITMARGNAARTGEHPGPAPRGTPERQWSAQIGELIVSSPAVVDGVAYVGSVDPTLVEGGGVHALDIETGEELWRSPIGGGDGVFTSPAVVDGVVYAGSYDGNVIAMDAQSGEERWRFRTDDLIYYSSPVVEDGLLVIGDQLGLLYGLDTDNGVLQWTFDAGAEGWVAAYTPAMTDGRVFVAGAAESHEEPVVLYVLDGETGEEIWHFTANAGEVRGTPAVADGLVLVSTSSGSIYALDTQDGEEVWRYDGAEELSATSPAIVGEQVIMITADGRLHLLDAESGEEMETMEFGGGLPFVTPPTVVDGVVYIVDEATELWAVDLETGDVRWSISTESVGSIPAIIDGLILIGDQYGVLTAYG